MSLQWSAAMISPADDFAGAPLLRTEVDCWVASADEMGNAHLVPLSHYWDGAALVLATPTETARAAPPNRMETR